MTTLRVEFDAITGDLVKGFRLAGRESDQLERKLGRAAKESLNVREAALRVERAEAAAARAMKRHGSDSVQAAAAANRLERAQNRLNHELGEATGANARLAAAEARTNAARAKTLSVTKGMASSLLTLTKRATLAGAALAGIGAGAAVKSAVDFEQQMSRVQGKLLVSRRAMAGLHKLAMDLGARTQFSASEAAAAMDELAAQGFSADRIFRVLPGTLSLAAASGTDLANAARIQTETLHGFGLEASRAAKVADVLAQISNRSAADIDSLQESLKYIAPVARASGQSLEDMGAALGLMANVGIKGSQAGTTLRTAMVRLQAPTEPVSDGLRDLGLRARDLYGPRGLKPLPDIIAKMTRGSEGLSKSTRNAALAHIFGREALSGMVALVEKGGPAIDREARALERSRGAARRAADIMRNNVAGAWDNFTGSVETAAIKLTQRFMPSIRRSLDGAADDMNRLTVTAGDFIDALFGREDRFYETTTGARELGMALHDIATTAHGIASEVTDAAVGLGKFVAHNDDARKLAGILAGVALSVKTIKTLGAITGLNKLGLAAVGGSGARTGTGAASGLLGGVAGGGAATAARAASMRALGLQFTAAAAGVYGANRASLAADDFYSRLVRNGGPGSGLVNGAGGLLGRIGKAGVWLGRKVPIGGVGTAGPSLDDIFPQVDTSKIDRDRRTLDRFTQQAMKLYRLRDSDALRSLARRIAGVAAASADGQKALDRFGREVDEAAKKVGASRLDVFRRQLRAVLDGPRWTTADMFVATVEGQWRKLPEKLRGPAGRSIIEAARAMERNGRLPRGATDRIIENLERRWDGLGPYLRSAGARSSRELGRTLADNKIARRVQGVVDDIAKRWGDAPRLARTTASNARVTWEVQMEFLRRKMRTTTGRQRDEAKRLYEALQSMERDVAGASRRAWKRSRDAIDEGLEWLKRKIEAFRVKSPLYIEPTTAPVAPVSDPLLGPVPLARVGAPSHRRGGQVRRFNLGGRVQALVSSGEEIVEPSGRSWMVPGPRVAADNVLASLPVGSQVFTEHGQSLRAAGMPDSQVLLEQMPHFAAGGKVVRGKVSYFGPPGDAVGSTASGLPSSAPGLALNLQPGTDSGWNNATTDRWVKAKQPFLVEVAGHRGVLPVIDKGPAGWTGKAIDITGAGVRRLGMDPEKFPTGAIGTATLLGRGAKIPAGLDGSSSFSYTRQPAITHSRRVDLMQPYGALDAFQQGFDSGVGGTRRLFRNWRGLDTDLFRSAISGVRANERDRPKRVKLTLGGDFGHLSAKKLAKGRLKGAHLKTAWRGVGPDGLGSAIRAIAAVVMGRFPGLQVTSTTGGRHADGSYHYKGQAVDIAGSGMTAAAGWVRNNVAGYLSEGIHNPNLSVKYGKGVDPSYWGPATWAGHADHIHLAATRLRRGGKVRRFQGGGAVGQVVGSTQANIGHSTGKRASVGRFVAKLSGIAPLLAAIGEAGADAGAVVERMRALAGRLEDAKTVSYRRLEKTRTTVQREIVALMKGGETGQERIQIRRLRGALTLVEGEMGKRVGAIVGRAQRLVDAIDRRAQTVSNRLALAGVDESSVEGIRALLGADRASRRSLRGQVDTLRQQLARARRLRETDAVRAIRDQIATVRDALTGLAVNVATRTRELAAARIEEFNAKFQERTEAGARLAERVTLDQRISGLSPDSIPGMRERLASLQQQRNMAAESLGPAITLMQRTLLSTGIGSQATQEAIRAYWAVADGLKGFDADLAELGRQLAQTQRYQPTDVRLALAQLTRDTSDDLAALREQEKLLTEDLNALDPNDPRNADAIIDLAGRLAGVRSSIDSLDQTIQDQEQRDQDLADLLRQIRDNQDRILAVATGESDRLLAFLTGAMNGSIGGRVGLGAQTPFYAGAGPRY